VGAMRNRPGRGTLEREQGAVADDLERRSPPQAPGAGQVAHHPMQAIPFPFRQDLPQGLRRAHAGAHGHPPARKQDLHQVRERNRPRNGRRETDRAFLFEVPHTVLDSPRGDGRPEVRGESSSWSAGRWRSIQVHDPIRPGVIAPADLLRASSSLTTSPWRVSNSLIERVSIPSQATTINLPRTGVRCIGRRRVQRRGCAGCDEEARRSGGSRELRRERRRPGAAGARTTGPARYSQRQAALGLRRAPTGRSDTRTSAASEAKRRNAQQRRVDEHEAPASPRGRAPGPASDPARRRHQ
jgi:hypothetical protein